MRSPISELNTEEKIREKINEIEEASDQKMKSAAKKIIEQHVLGDMMKRMTNLYALMERYSPERGSMSIKVSYSTLIMVQTVENALSGRNVPVKAKRKRSRAMTTRQNVGGWLIRCNPWKGKKNTRSVRRLLNGHSATLSKI
jgi:hypothetical protein